MLFTSFTTEKDLPSGDKREMSALFRTTMSLYYAVEWITHLVNGSDKIRLQDCIWVCVPKDGHFLLKCSNKES